MGRGERDKRVQSEQTGYEKNRKRKLKTPKINFPNLPLGRNVLLIIFYLRSALPVIKLGWGHSEMSYCKPTRISLRPAICLCFILCLVKTNHLLLYLQKDPLSPWTSELSTEKKISVAKGMSSVFIWASEACIAITQAMYSIGTQARQYVWTFSNPSPNSPKWATSIVFLDKGQSVPKRHLW